MRLALLDILACPMCADAPLELFALAGSGPRLETGVLRCRGCDRFYPVQAGLPIMLPDGMRDARQADLLQRWRHRLPAGSRGALDADCARIRTCAAGSDDSLLARRREQSLRDRESGIYDSLYPDARHRAEIETYLSLCRPERDLRTLEIGCGTGRVTRHLLAAGAEILAVDCSRASLEVLAARATGGVLDRVCGDAVHLPVRRDRFSLAVALGVFYHLPGRDEREWALQAALDALEPGGALVVSLYNLSLPKRVGAALGLDPTGRKQGRKGDREGGIYFYRHGAAEARRWLGARAEVECFEGVNHQIPIVGRRIPDPLFARLDGLLARTPLSLLLARELVARVRKR
ncbi:MAG: methyltransferase domain-containing protein [Deltaproteobacteria bacterium]|nr:methyltransferase domain-containing protein [Deltaproteobacteria bacterium]